MRVAHNIFKRVIAGCVLICLLAVNIWGGGYTGRAASPPLFTDNFENYNTGPLASNVKGVWRKVANKSQESSSIDVAANEQKKALKITSAGVSNPFLDTDLIDMYGKKAVIKLRVKTEGQGYARLMLMNEYDKTYTELLRFGSKKIIFAGKDFASLLVYKKWYDAEIILDTTNANNVEADVKINGKTALKDKTVAALASKPVIGLRFDANSGHTMYIDEITVEDADENTTKGNEADRQEQQPQRMVTPPKEHPRLFIRKSDIEGIRKKLTYPEMAKVWQQVCNESKLEHDGRLAESSKGNYNPVIRKVIEANALRYVLEGDEASGKKAVSMMKNMLETVTFSNGSDVTRDIGQVLLTGGIVYDWCYNLIAKEQKSLWVGHLERIASQMEIGYPARLMSGMVGHSSEAQLLRDQLGAGVAIYDEKPDMYSNAAQRIFDVYIPARNFWYKSHMYHQGESYGTYRFQWDLFATWIFDRMGFGNVFSAEQGMTPYRWLYERRPDGQLMRDGDASQASKNLSGSYWNFTTTMLLASSYYKDPYLREEFLVQYANNPWDTDEIWMVLFNDPAVAPAAQSTLPLTKYFPSPGGSMIARTGWNMGKDSQDVVAEMKVSEYMFNNHQHLDAGQFQLYYKGALAIDSGMYQGKNGGYGSNHDINYQKRTIAHNSLLVVDPGEQFLYNNMPIENDGGQRWPLDAKEPSTLSEILNKGYHTATVLGHDFGPDPVTPDYSYLKGDLKDAYSDKVKDYKRSFVFLNLKNDVHPAALIVYDRVAAKNKDFKKKWLLHSMEEPVVAANTITIGRSEKGYNGKLVDTVLLPQKDSLKIEKIGGPGKEFLVNGTNYPQTPQSELNSDEIGSWRVELSPLHQAETDTFLNVMQVMDNNSTAEPLTVQSVEDEHFIGVHIQDRIVLFSKNGEEQDENFTIAIQGQEEKIRYMIADVKEGIWKVQGHNFQQEIYVSAEAGLLYFEGAPGEYTLERKGEGQPEKKVQLPVKLQPAEIKLKFNGEYLYSDEKPKMENDRVLVPIRVIAQRLGAKVDYDQTTKEITLAMGDKQIKLTAESQNALVNGEPYSLETPAKILQDRLFLPVRFVSEQLGALVDWDETAKVVKITSNGTGQIYSGQNASWSAEDGVNTGINTIDGDMNTRWSAEGDGAWIQYDVGEIKQLDQIGIAWYNGDSRLSRFSILISEDGQKWSQVYQGQNSGLTNEMENITFASVKGRYIKIIGHGNSYNSWNSITEVKLP